MAAVLDVWITKPGNPCYVDDHPWVVHVFDSAGNVYRWATKDYGNLPAPQGHWADTIPPGCYVVQATGKDSNGNPISTDHAIVAVGCDGLACVRLYVAGSKGSGPGPCEITITDVTGIGSPDPGSVNVSGTAVNCTEIEVTLTCRTQQTAHAVAVVSGGTWTATVGTKDLRCKCGRGVKVTAVCKDDPKCVAEFVSENLSCTSRATSRSS
jgi:hypothetical protein